MFVLGRGFVAGPHPRQGPALQPPCSVYSLACTKAKVRITQIDDPVKMTPREKQKSGSAAGGDFPFSGELRLAIRILGIFVIIILTVVLFRFRHAPNALPPRPFEPEPPVEVRPEIPPEPGGRGAPGEFRFAAEEAIVPRSGPDAGFEPVLDVTLQKGQRIYAVQGVGPWLRIRHAPEDECSFGWVNRFVTLPSSGKSSAQPEEDIAILKDMGVLATVAPEANAARVLSEAWHGLDPAVQRGIARTLAFYCGDRNGTGRNWVEIVDDATQKKLARFSETMGYRAIQKSPMAVDHSASP